MVEDGVLVGGVEEAGEVEAGFDVEEVEWGGVGEGQRGLGEGGAGGKDGEEPEALNLLKILSLLNELQPQLTGPLIMPQNILIALLKRDPVIEMHGLL